MQTFINHDSRWIGWMSYDNPKKMPFHVPWNSCCQPGCCRMVVIDDIYQPHLQLSHCSFHLWLVFFSQTHHPPRLIDQYLTLFLPTKTCFLISLKSHPLVNYLSWLVVEPYSSEKYAKVSRDDDIPNMMGKSKQIHGSSHHQAVSCLTSVFMGSSPIVQSTTVLFARAPPFPATGSPPWCPEALDTGNATPATRPVLVTGVWEGLEQL
jgi:hypothetical protein